MKSKTVDLRSGLSVDLGVAQSGINMNARVYRHSLGILTNKSHIRIELYHASNGMQSVDTEFGNIEHAIAYGMQGISDVMLYKQVRLLERSIKDNWNRITLEIFRNDECELRRIAPAISYYQECTVRYMPGLVFNKVPKCKIRMIVSPAFNTDFMIEKGQYYLILNICKSSVIIR